MRRFHGEDAIRAVVDFVGDNQPDCLCEQADDWIRATLARGEGMHIIVRTMETLYAERAACPDGHVLCLELATFISERNFGALGGFNGRATLIAEIMQRIVDGGAVEEEGDIARCPFNAPPVMATPPHPPEVPQPDPSPQ